MESIIRISETHGIAALPFPLTHPLITSITSAQFDIVNINIAGIRETSHAFEKIYSI